MLNQPKAHRGLRHLAIFVQNLEACVDFYTRLLGLKLVWQPDPDNFYLSSGDDNLALHRAPPNFSASASQRLDHLGFFLSEPNQVDEWCSFLEAQGVIIKAKPKDHRDGTRSFYCADPDGNMVQMIYYPV